MTESEVLIKTAFYDAMARSGASFVPVLGYEGAGDFGDVAKEYRAQREGVGVMDCSMMQKWDVRGQDAATFAQRVCANNIIDMADGQVRYGPICNEAGKVLDDVTVFRFSSDHFWVVTNTPELGDYFAAAADGLGVEIELATAQLPHLFVQGPDSREALAAITDYDVGNLKYFRFTPEKIDVGGVPAWLSRTGVSGEIGYELFVAPEHAADLWDVLVTRAGAQPYGMAAVDTVRIEIGIIVPGADYQPGEVSPYDITLGRLVDLTKPFIGRDSVAEAVQTSDIVTVVLDGNVLPDPGSELTVGGAKVGTLTSPTQSPLFGLMGMATVDVDHTAPGTRFEVQAGAATATAVVYDTHPAYDPQKLRVRG
ncbi:MAG TPA: aminomethyltransferase family protein [Baekduia sp.]|nr:aminomethyltransferase family protein [Baekduia sp.]